MKRIILSLALLMIILLALPAAITVKAQTISFTASDLAGESLYHPTSLQFGPDGRLYVAQQDGKIFAYTACANTPRQTLATL